MARRLGNISRETIPLLILFVAQQKPSRGGLWHPILMQFYSGPLMQLLSGVDTLSRVTPSAASEHVSELLGFPISRSLTTSCVCLEPRPLPSPGIIRLQRYYEPLRHPSAPDLSLAGVRLIIPDHALGLPVLRALSLCTCCRHYPGAAAGRRLRSSHPAVSAFPGRVAGSACTSSFSRSHDVLWVAIDPASK